MYFHEVEYTDVWEKRNTEGLKHIGSCLKIGRG